MMTMTQLSLLVTWVGRVAVAVMHPPQHPVSAIGPASADAVVGADGGDEKHYRIVRHFWCPLR